MKHTLILITLMMLITISCSSSSQSPVTPKGSDIPITDSDSDTSGLLFEGTFEIDLEKMQITNYENRQSSLIYDITGFLPDKCPGGCFRFSIVGIVGTVLEIELVIENPVDMAVYDMRVQYTNLFGKTVLNPDSYTDFLGTFVSHIYPFTAFAKDAPNRAFPVGPGVMETETLYLDFPPGSPAAVNYAITASLPGNTQEPYEISNMEQIGTLTPTGGSASIRCKVMDHQNNISQVWFDARPLMGVPVQMMHAAQEHYYVAEITNSLGIPVGQYNGLILAMSPNPQNISTYNYVTVTISEDEETTCDEVYRDEIHDGTMLNYERSYGIAFTHDGLLLARVSDANGYHIYGFDVTQPGDITGVPIITDGLHLNHTLGDIDVCDVTGHIIYAISGGGWMEGLLNTFVVYSSDGELIGEYQSENTHHLQGVDTDAYGGIWVIGHSFVNPIPDPEFSDTRPDQYYLNRYIWDSVAGVYVYDSNKSSNVTDTQKYAHYPSIYDIAVSFVDDLVLVYSTGSSRKGQITAYDFSGSTTVHAYTKDGLFPNGYGSHGHYNWRSAGDIDIDRSNLNHEHCRVLISMRHSWTIGQSFAKLDIQGSVIDHWLNPDADDEDRFFWSHAINRDSSHPWGSYMVATEDSSTFGGNPARFHIFEVSEGW